MPKGYLSEIFVSFQGEGLYAGRRHLFLRLSGCHLRCRYCDTPGSLERTPSFRVYSDGTSVLEGANPVTAGEAIAHGMAVSPALEGAIKDIVSQYWNDDRFTTAAAIKALVDTTQKRR